MAPRKKPDATDTEPPEEARPDTTATPLLVEDGKLLSPDVEFTADTLLRWLEGLADKKKKPQMRERAWDYALAIVGEDYTNGQELLGIPEDWWEKHRVMRAHWEVIRASIGTDVIRLNVFGTPVKAPPGLATPATSSMSGASSDSAILLSGLADIMKESRESLAEMQKSHEKAAAEQAQAAADLSLKAIQTVSISNAKIAVQPAALNCGVNGLTPSPADMFAWIEDIRAKHNTIAGMTRTFLSHILRNPTGSASDFKAFLNENERKALYANISDKVPRHVLRSVWPTNELDGTGLIHALLQHAINPTEKSITLKRDTQFYVNTKALTKIQHFPEEHLEMQRSLMDVRWTVGTQPEELMKVVEGVYSNYPTVSKSITDFWEKSKKDQEAVDETIANIPRYMDRYMELNRITVDKEKSSDWKEAKKRARAQSDPSPHKPEGEVKERPPLRSWKPPLEFTAEKDRIKNGPCKWHKKGMCDWKEYCNMDHSAAAMATLPPPGQPRPPPKSARNASAVSAIEDEKDAIIAALAQRLEQLEGKLTLMFRVPVPTAGVRAALIPRPTSYLAAVKSHLSRTEVWSRPTNEKLRAPGYLAALRKDLEMVRINQGIPPKITNI